MTNVLIDLSPLSLTPKIIPPMSQQLPNESLRFWSGVTEAITSKQYSKATGLKQELEEEQRVKTAARKEQGVEWKPRFFTAATTPLGRPELTSEGQETLRKLEAGSWELEEV